MPPRMQRVGLPGRISASESRHVSEGNKTVKIRTLCGYGRSGALFCNRARNRWRIP